MVRGMRAGPVPTPDPGRPPFAAAEPAELRAGLVPDDAAAFDEDLRRARRRARPDDDAEVAATLDSWRRIAWVTRTVGAERYTQLLTDVARRLRTLEEHPEAVAWRRSEVRPRSAYTVLLDPLAESQVASLPHDERAAFDETLAVLQGTPWNGRPFHRSSSEIPVRTTPLGKAGMITYMILEQRLRVDVLLVSCADSASGD